MERYAGKDYEAPIKGSFLNRMAKLSEDKTLTKEIDEKTSFSDGYRKGSLNYATASRHLSLKALGLDRFIEANTNVVWKRDGDNIIRLEQDLDWVDEYLKDNK